jgi:hypothetical protein
MANRAVEEYAADDGSSDVFGADGALVPNQTATTGTTDRSFSFNGTASATDLLIVEIKESSTGNWTPATQLYPFSSGNNAGATNFYGIRGAWTSSTVYRVQFGNQGDRVSSSSSSAGATPWSTLYSAGARFRVRKVSGGAVVGYPIGARNIVGDTTGTTVPGGYIGERLTSSGSATAWTSGQYMDGGNAGLTLTPGVWLIKSQHVYTLGGDTAISEYTYGVGTASGNSATGLTEYITHRNAANNPAGNQRFVSPTTYVNISASTTYYPKFYLVGTRSAGTVTSSLEAVRIA